MNEKQYAIIFGDNFVGYDQEVFNDSGANVQYHSKAYNKPIRMGIARSTGAHRVATILREKNINTEVIDFFSEFNLDELIKILDFYKNKNVIMIGFSVVLNTFEEDYINNFISIIREKFPKTKIIVGGQKPWEKGIKTADLYLEGYIESAIDKLLMYLKNNDSHDFKIEEYEGIKFVNCTKDYPLSDTKKLRNIYIHSDFIDSNEALALEVSRGCIFACKFCDFPLLGRKKTDYVRDEDDLYEELLYNYKMFGTKTYFIVDETYNESLQKIESLFKVSKRLNFKLELMAFIRLDLLYAIENSLEMCYETGFKAFAIGIESFSEKTSKSIGKGFNGKKGKEYLKYIKSKYPNISLHCSFLVGLPYESSQEITESIEWANDSEVIDSWAVSHLKISETPVSFQSYFAKNWAMYGYKKVSVDENGNIVWKNKYYTYDEAINLSNKLNGYQYENKKMNIWHAFTTTALGFKLDQILFHKRNDKQLMLKIYKLSKKFVNDYKIKKIQYFENFT